MSSNFDEKRPAAGPQGGRTDGDDSASGVPDGNPPNSSPPPQPGDDGYDVHDARTLGDESVAPLPPASASSSGDSQASSRPDDVGSAPTYDSAHEVDPLRDTDDADDDDSGHPQIPQTADEFLEHVRFCRVLTEQTIAEFRQQHDSLPNSAAEVAKLLLTQGLLTEYQREILRLGRTHGLAMGNYLLLEKIGEGGMGVVFRARHRRMNRVVAIKTLTASMTYSADAVRRFHREVEVAGRLEHDNIARAYDADESNEVHYLVMEYIDGPNIAAYVRQKGRLPLAAAIQLTLQAARGLAYAHAQGIIHRDIKPPNLLLSRQGVLKVTDMGLAAMIRESNSDLTRSGRVMGTPDFMAPEQAVNAKAVDGRADIYSLGCTLFYLLLGRPPAPEGSLTEKLLWHQAQSVGSLREHLPEASPKLDTVFQQMVAKKPEQRQASMDVVVEQLETCLAEFSSISDLSVAGIALRQEIASSADLSHQPPSADNPITVPDEDTIVTTASDHDTAEVNANANTGRSPIWLVAIGILLALGLGGGIYTMWPSSPPVVQPSLVRVSIDSNPQGAVVMIAGREEGTTPCFVEVEEGKNQQLVLRHPGYQDLQETVDSQQDQVVVFNLKPLPRVDRQATVAVTIEPNYVPVSAQLNGTSIDAHAKPLQLLVPNDRTSTLLLTAAGYQPFELQIDPRESLAFDVQLVKIEPAKLPHQDWLAAIFTAQGRAIIRDDAGVEHRAGNLSELPQEFTLIGVDLTTATTFAPEDLRQLSEVVGVAWETLILSNPKIESQHLRGLSNLEQLQRLSLAGTKVDDTWRMGLGSMPELRSLNLSNNSAITSKALSGIAESCPQLQQLLLSKTKVDDAVFSFIEGLDRLSILQLDNCPISGAQIASLAQYGDLLQIGLNGTNFDRQHIGKLSKLKSQVFVDLRQTDVTDRLVANTELACRVVADLETDQPLSAVDRLYAAGGRILVPQANSRKPELVEDRIAANDVARIRAIKLAPGVTPEVCNILASLSNSDIVYLDLSGTGIAAAELSRLSQVKTLAPVKFVDLSRNSMRDINLLQGFPNLIQLDLSQSDLQADDLPKLGGLRDRLTSLRISDTRVGGADGGQQFVRQINNFTKLQTLDAQTPNISFASRENLRNNREKDRPSLTSHFPALKDEEQRRVIHRAFGNASLNKNGVAVSIATRQAPIGSLDDSASDGSFQVTRVAVGTVDFTIDQLATLKSLPQLEALDLASAHQLKAEPLVGLLDEFPKLKKLAVSSKIVDATNPASVAAGKKLNEKFDLSFPAQQNPDLAAAQWVLQQGGSLKIERQDGKEDSLSDLSELSEDGSALPWEASAPFHVTEVNLTGANLLQVGRDLPRILATCKKLRKLNLAGTKFPGELVKQIPNISPSIKHLNIVDLTTGSGDAANINSFRGNNTLVTLELSVSAALTLQQGFAGFSGTKLENLHLVGLDAEANAKQMDIIYSMSDWPKRGNLHRVRLSKAVIGSRTAILVGQKLKDLTVLEVQLNDASAFSDVKTGFLRGVANSKKCRIIEIKNSEEVFP